MFAKIASFFFMLCLIISSLFGTSLKGYESKALFNDPDFSNGFYVLSQENNAEGTERKGVFSYGENESSPSWMIAQWNSGNCLWDNNVSSDKYTITDNSTKWVTYNPEEKSVSLRLNASEIYKGEPAGYESWPHLLLEQSPINDYFTLSDEEKSFYNLEDNRIVLDLDIKITDYKKSTNPEGINATQFLAYFYLKDTDGHNFIWFGVNLFDDRSLGDTYWAKDTLSGNMIYSVSTKDTYGFKSRALLKNGEPVVSDDWTSIKSDLTPYLKDCIKRANKDNVFGEKVSLADFYIGGTNIGFEVHGNSDCTVEIKNFNLTSYK